MILALDPGKNLGMALVSPAGGLVEGAIITLADLDALAWSRMTEVVVGDGTGSDLVQERLQLLGIDFVLIDETDTSIEARKLYFRANPVRGLQRLFPAGLRTPPRAIDDFAAYAIALRYLKWSRRPP